MIIANNVSKSFGRLIVLNNVSVTCNAGQAVALIGPNGSGKTTLIKCLLGMVVPDSGFITFDKHNIQHHWEYRKHIGYMPQIGRYPDNMTIAQVLDMIKDLRKSPDAEIDNELIELFNIKSILNKRMRTLSGGTRQKVSAAIAFLFNPKVLILDEPTAGLDPESSEILKHKIVEERKKGKLVLITSHILSDLDELVSEVIYMQEGEIRFHKNVDELKKVTGEDRLSKVVASIMKNK
jgi:Cu-processing system ATP-binding protein